MSKTQSKGGLLSYDSVTHTIVVKVMHSDSASFSRSVRPCANKVFDAFMRSPEGREWISQGYAHFSSRADFGAVEGGSLITYTLTL